MALETTLTTAREEFPWSLALLGGVLLSALALGPSYGYCADGPARGMPFAVVRPAHDISLDAIYVGTIARVPSEFWLIGFAGNLLLWTVASAALLFVYRRLRGDG